MALLNTRAVSRTGEVAFLVSGFYLAYRHEAAGAARMWRDASRAPGERAILSSVVAGLEAT
jgi:hypothetical protein